MTKKYLIILIQLFAFQLTDCAQTNEFLQYCSQSNKFHNLNLKFCGNNNEIINITEADFIGKIEKITTPTRCYYSQNLTDNRKIQFSANLSDNIAPFPVNKFFSDIFPYNIFCNLTWQTQHATYLFPSYDNELCKNYFLLYNLYLHQNRYFACQIM